MGEDEELLLPDAIGNRPGDIINIDCEILHPITHLVGVACKCIEHRRVHEHGTQAGHTDPSTPVRNRQPLRQRNRCVFGHRIRCGTDVGQETCR